MLIQWDSPIDIAAARSLASALCEYACNGDVGRPEKGDAVYDAVTEGRDFGAKYSSCGDLAHWMLFTLGVRQPFLNRSSIGKGWKQGANVSRLAWCAYARTPTASDRFEPGDILVIWNSPKGTDAHVCVVLEDCREDDVSDIRTANYGAPGGAIRDSKVSYAKSKTGRFPVLGTRRIQRWVPLNRVLEGSQAANMLVAAEDPTHGDNGEVLWTSPEVQP